MSDIADRYRPLADRFSDLLKAVPQDKWDAPSPCEGWTARDVAAHVVTTLQEFLQRQELGGPPAPAGDADVLAAWPAVRDRVQEVLDDPALAEAPYDGYFGPTSPEQTLDTFYLSDLLVHTWDLATATGLTQFESMPSEVVAHCHAHLAELPEEAIRSEGIYGQPLEVAEDADPQEKFLAFIGRRSG